MDRDRDNEDKFLNRLMIVCIILMIICAIVSSIVLIVHKAQAKDLGVQGNTWEIKESDPIEDIKNKIKAMELNGEIDKHNEIIKEKVKENIINPKNLGVLRATEDREYYYDPSISKPYDLKDHKGQVYYKAGTRVNPLDKVSLENKLIFIDGEDEEQLKYMIDIYKKSEIKPTIILTGGSPVKLEEEYKLDFYFDQEGEIIKKLGIKAVPAVVAQEGKMLRVREVRLK